MESVLGNRDLTRLISSYVEGPRTISRTMPFVSREAREATRGMYVHPAELMPLCLEELTVGLANLAFTDVHTLLKISGKQNTALPLDKVTFTFREQDQRRVLRFLRRRTAFSTGYGPGWIVVQGMRDSSFGFQIYKEDQRYRAAFIPDVVQSGLEQRDVEGFEHNFISPDEKDLKLLHHLSQFGRFLRGVGGEVFISYDLPIIAFHSVLKSYAMNLLTKTPPHKIKVSIHFPSLTTFEFYHFRPGSRQRELYPVSFELDVTRDCSLRISKVMGTPGKADEESVIGVLPYDPEAFLGIRGSAGRRKKPASETADVFTFGEVDECPKSGCIVSGGRRAKQKRSYKRASSLSK